MSDLSEKGAPLMMFNQKIEHKNNKNSENTRLIDHESKEHKSEDDTEHKNNNSKNNDPTNSISELKEILNNSEYKESDILINNSDHYTVIKTSIPTHFCCFKLSDDFRYLLFSYLSSKKINEQHQLALEELKKYINQNADLSLDQAGHISNEENSYQNPSEYRQQPDFFSNHKLLTKGVLNKFSDFLNVGSTDSLKIENKFSNENQEMDNTTENIVPPGDITLLEDLIKNVILLAAENMKEYYYSRWSNIDRNVDDILYIVKAN